MNKLTKLMLATAVLATSGFATEIEEDVIIKSGWGITGSDAASIAEGITVTMQGDNGAASNLVISGSGSLSNEGAVELHDASSIIVSSNADTPFSNIGVVNLSKVTDFSNFVVDILNANGAKIVVPSAKKTITAGEASKFKFTGPSDANEQCTIEVVGETKSLEVEGTSLTISQSSSDTYGSLEELKKKLGVSIENESNLELTGDNLSDISLKNVINHELNNENNRELTFDVAQEGLSSRNAYLDNETTINFGFKGEKGLDVELNGYHKKIFLGDNSQMMSKIIIEGDAEFNNEIPQGGIEVCGELTLDCSEGSQTIAGEIKARALIVSPGTKLVIKDKLTTGWIERSLLNFASTNGQIIKYSLGSDYCYVDYNSDSSGNIYVSNKNDLLSNGSLKYHNSNAGWNLSNTTLDLYLIDDTKIERSENMKRGAGWFLYVLSGIARGEFTQK